MPVVPAYSIGNSQAFYSWYDSFGILEWISRKTQVQREGGRERGRGRERKRGRE